MKYDIQDPAIRELTHQELENVSGGGVVSAVAGAVKVVAKDVTEKVVRTFSTGSIGGVGLPGGGSCGCIQA